MPVPVQVQWGARIGTWRDHNPAGNARASASSPRDAPVSLPAGDRKGRRRVLWMRMILASGAHLCELRGVWRPGWDTRGELPAPTYDSVCDGDGRTGRSASCSTQPSSPTTLLAHFFDVSGTRAFKRTKAQYKSAVWVVDETQRAIAKASIARLSAAIGDDGTVVTEVLDFKSWADAEEAPELHAQAQGGEAARARCGALGRRVGGRGGGNESLLVSMTPPGRNAKIRDPG